MWNGEVSHVTPQFGPKGWTDCDIINYKLLVGLSRTDFTEADLNPPWRLKTDTRFGFHRMRAEFVLQR